ncbi:hypothetical protein [Carboxylicivirga sp. M1479]|uniref:hypothetical protein n=1 Tax=Carboxylicivirga sp. M1479 TaxID=2594476 RepID=UPI0011789B0F|nr:hypothetical protein [Carboxylicivirga sp. M1479]TRX70718.1 hypothetical protein FNN09_10620 [Carboxylicivirga sp. M1479]
MPGKKIIQELPDKLYHIESVHYKNIEVGDTIYITGVELGGHGIKTLNNIKEAPYLTKDEKLLLSSFINEDLDITRTEFDALYTRIKKQKLSEINGNIFESIRVEIMYEMIRRELDIKLISRLKCIFLCNKKYIERWYNLLNRHRNPVIYELSAINTNSFLIRDEYHCQDYNTTWFQFEKYWSELSALNLTMYEILFTGNLKVTQIHDSFESVRRANVMEYNR